MKLKAFSCKGKVNYTTQLHLQSFYIGFFSSLIFENSILISLLCILIRLINYLKITQTEPDFPSFSPLRLQHLPITVNNTNFKLHPSVNICITVITAQEEAIAMPVMTCTHQTKRDQRKLNKYNTEKTFMSQSPLQQLFVGNVSPSQLTELKKKQTVGVGNRFLIFS